MKVGGKKIVERKSVAVTLKRPSGDVVFTLTALPLGWDERMDVIGALVAPEPPKRYPLNPDRSAIVNPLTKKAELTEDESDPKYQRARKAWYRRYMAFKFRELVRGDEAVTFDVVEPTATDKKPWDEYLDKLVAELSESGFTAQELDFFVGLGEKLATNIDPKAAVAAFLNEQNPAQEAPEEPTEASSETSSTSV